MVVSATDGTNVGVRVVQPPSILVTNLFERYPEYTWTSFTPAPGFQDGHTVTLTDENIASVNGEYKIYTDVSTLGVNYTHKAFIQSSEVGWFGFHNSLVASLYVEMPKAVVLEYYQLSGTTGHDQALPDEWALYGSSDQGASWSLVSEVTDSPLAANDVKTIQLSAPSSAPYDRFKLTLRKTTDTSDPYIGLSNLKFGIQATYTGSDKIQLQISEASVWTGYTETGFFDAYESVVSNSVVESFNGRYKVYGDRDSSGTGGYYPYKAITTHTTVGGWFGKVDGHTDGTLYIELPVSVQLHSYKISALAGHDPAIPDEWTLSGSSDGGTTWNVISDVPGATLEVDVLSTVTLDTPVAPYSMFKLNLRKTTDLSDTWIAVGKFIPIVYASF